MNIKFSWTETPHGLIEPRCQVSEIYKDGFNLIDCVLIDDGGIGYDIFIPWLKEAGSKISLIRTKHIKSHDWSCEAWGVKLTKTEAIVYSLHEEEYFQVFSLTTFEEILLKWINFIEGEADLTKILTFKVK